jgi:hypothetical protein
MSRTRKAVPLNGTSTITEPSASSWATPLFARPRRPLASDPHPGDPRGLQLAGAQPPIQRGGGVDVRARPVRGVGDVGPVDAV